VWWHFVWITFLSWILNQIVVLADFSSLWTLFENRQLCLTQPHSWGRLLFHCPKNLLGHPLVQSLANLSFRASLSKVGCRLPIIANLEPKWRYTDSHVAINRFLWPLVGRYLLEVYLTPHSLNSPCASHALLATQEHLICGANSCCFGRAQILSCKLTVSVSGHLGCLLLSVTIPYWEGEPIARLVNFLLTSKSVHLKSYSLGEACLKVGLPGWWALLNCNVALSYADSYRRFSIQYCKIESACLSA
jgi:hypothetical protein